MSDFNELLQSGIQAARAGDNETARKLLAGAIRLNPKSETAWLWMSGVVRTREERIKVLQQVLSINPDNQVAQKGLQALGVELDEPEGVEADEPEEEAAPPPPEKPKKPLGIGMTPEPALEPELEAEPELASEPEPESEPEAAWDAIAAAQSGDEPESREEAALVQAASKYEEDPTPSAYDFDVNLANIPVSEEYDSTGEPVPHPSDEAIRSAKAEALELLDELTPERKYDTKWVRAEAEALGVSSADVARLSSMRTRRMVPYVLAGVGVLGIIGLILFTSVTIIRSVNRSAEATRIANLPTPITPTITLTPTSTVTPMPTRTPLPESLALTLEPTVTPGQAPRGDLEFRITPTPPYVLTPHGSSLLTNANQAFYAGDYEEAIEFVRQAREEGDNDIDGYYIEGLSLMRLGDEEAARDIFLDGLDIQPGFAPLNVEMGRIYLEEGSLAQARDAFETAKQSDPNYLAPYIELAGIELLQGNIDEAQAEVQAARSTGRYSYDVNLLLLESEIAEQQADFERALALAKLAYYIDPSSEEVNARLADVRLEFGYYDTAIVDLESYLIEVFPSSATNWAWLGTAYERVGRSDDALLGFSRALQLDDENARAYIGRGQYYLEQDQFDEALEDFNQAVDLNPTSVDALIGRAAAYTELEQYDDALEDFDTIFDLTSASTPLAILTDEEVNADIDLVLLYSETLVQTDNPQDVFRLASEVLAREITEEQRARAYTIRALAQFEQGNFAGARADVEVALEIEDTGYRHYLRGRILDEFGLTGQAIREYEWVLLWDTVYDFDFADEAAERLDELADN